MTTKIASVLLVIAMLAFAPALFGQATTDVTVAWDHDGGCAGFELWIWQANWSNPLDPLTAVKIGGDPLERVEIPNANARQGVIHVAAGTWIITCVAYNLGVPAELKSYSIESDQLPILVPDKPPPPGNVRIIAIIMAISGGLLGLILLIAKAMGRI